VHSGVAPDVSTAGETQLLENVRQAWAEVLDLPDPAGVPLDTSFLEAGGSSLLLIMLWEELHGLTDKVLKVSDLFVHSTVRRQAELLAGTAARRPGPAGAGDRQKLVGRAGRS